MYEKPFLDHFSQQMCKKKCSNIKSVLGRGQRDQIFFGLFHVSGNFKEKNFEKKFGMTKIDRHFLLPNVVICFTLYTREIARNHLSYFVACKCVIYFRVPCLICSQMDLSHNFFSLVAPLSKAFEFSCRF